MSNENFEDPKIALTFSLLKHMDYITARLSDLEESGPDTGFHKEITRAALSMALLLRRIVLTDDEKDMLNLRNNITLDNYSDIHSKYILDAYTIINAYMNNTYFADFHKAKPKFKETGHI